MNLGGGGTYRKQLEVNMIKIHCTLVLNSQKDQWKCYIKKELLSLLSFLVCY